MGLGGLNEVVLGGEKLKMKFLLTLKPLVVFGFFGGFGGLEVAYDEMMKSRAQIVMTFWW